MFRKLSLFVLATGFSAQASPELLNSFDVSAIAYQMTKAFREAEKAANPVGQEPRWSTKLPQDRLFECRVFPILEDAGIPGRSEESAFKFAPFGRMLLENTAFRAHFKHMRWYGEDRRFQRELLGRAEGLGMLEVIRIDKDGSLIAEAQVKNEDYVPLVLALTNRMDLSGRVTFKDFQAKRLAFPAVLRDVGWSVLTYTYCPH